MGTNTSLSPLQMELLEDLGASLDAEVHFSALKARTSYSRMYGVLSDEEYYSKRRIIEPTDDEVIPFLEEKLAAFFDMGDNATVKRLYQVLDTTFDPIQIDVSLGPGFDKTLYVKNNDVNRSFGTLLYNRSMDGRVLHFEANQDTYVVEAVEGEHPKTDETYLENPDVARAVIELEPFLSTFYCGDIVCNPENYVVKGAKANVIDFDNIFTPNAYLFFSPHDEYPGSKDEFEARNRASYSRFRRALIREKDNISEILTSLDTTPYLNRQTSALLDLEGANTLGDLLRQSTQEVMNTPSSEYRKVYDGRYPAK